MRLLPPPQTRGCAPRSRQPARPGPSVLRRRGHALEGRSPDLLRRCDFEEFKKIMLYKPSKAGAPEAAPA